MRVIKHSPYYSENQFTELLKKKSGLCILDLNIRNMYANFDELCLFIDRVNTSNQLAQYS